MRPWRTTLPLIFLLTTVGACGPSRDNSAAEEAGGAMESAADQLGEATNAFVDDVRQSVSVIDAQIDDLNRQYADASGGAADAWDETKANIVQARQDLESSLSELGSATSERASRLRTQVADELATLARRVDRAQLEASGSAEAFMTASRDQLEEIDQNIESLQSEVAQLPADARSETSDAIDDLRSQAEDLHQRVGDLTAEDIADARNDVADAIASLAASVRRQLFEVRHDLTTD